MEMMLDKKQSQAIFLFKFKMGHKALETTCNINNAFGPGAANKRTVQRSLRKLCKGDKSFEEEEHSGQPPEGNNIIKADPLTTTREVAKELNVDRAMVGHLAFEANWKGEKPR